MLNFIPFFPLNWVRVSQQKQTLNTRRQWKANGLTRIGWRLRFNRIKDAQRISLNLRLEITLIVRGQDSEGKDHRIGKLGVLNTKSQTFLMLFKALSDRLFLK